MIEKFQTLEVGGRKSSKAWKFFAVLFPMLGSLAMAQGPGSLTGFFQAWWGAASALDPYERLFPTAYWYPSADLNNTDRMLGISSTNTVNAASVTTNGWEFNGTSQRLDMGRPTEIELGTNLQYSMAAWVRASSVSGLRGIMGKTFAFGGQRWGMGQDGANHFNILDFNSANVVFSSVGTAITNTWYHLAFTIDRSVSSNIFLYRDGVRIATASFTVTNAITYAGSVNTPFRFGSYNDGGGLPANFWSGLIDQAAVWNGRALTSNEVFNLFQETRSGRK
jgi:hypothetical protein